MSGMVVTRDSPVPGFNAQAVDRARGQSRRPPLSEPGGGSSAGIHLTGLVPDHGFLIRLEASSMNRIDRLTGMILLLQGQRVITAEQIAAHFEISVRTV